MNNGDGTWTKTILGDTVVYRQSKYDFEYLYLEHPTMEYQIALSMSGTDALSGTPDDGGKWWWWTISDDLQRVGGDPYFD